MYPGSESQEKIEVIEESVSEGDSRRLRDGEFFNMSIPTLLSNSQENFRCSIILN